MSTNVKRALLLGGEAELRGAMPNPFPVKPSVCRGHQRELKADSVGAVGVARW